MKFRLFGGLDCPDWFLSILATMSSASVESVAIFLDTSVEKLCGTEPDWDTVMEKASTYDINHHGIKELLGGMHTIVSNVIRYAMTPSQVTQELTMLGLPKEMADAISQKISSEESRLKTYANERIPRKATVLSTETSVRQPEDATFPVVRLSLTTGSTQKPISSTRQVEMTTSQFRHLNVELRNAYAEMIRK
eukprot:TRINITY_DN30536_c0_g1_i1.p1 TRINITY_DN30536_c0_g1~~TRINITY_DN30536_c0_g1_i1.p1  ORF type:complete len:212 (+),score=24.01 TRINITY_DN30536_c0_g1_i1:60-638(+)